jgi:hypothetical protein
MSTPTSSFNDANPMPRKRKPPLTSPAPKANGGKDDSVSLAWGLGKRYQAVTYHEQRGYHKKKAEPKLRWVF